MQHVKQKVEDSLHPSLIQQAHLNTPKCQIREYVYFSLTQAVSSL